jgi:hypothetical protein
MLLIVVTVCPCASGAANRLARSVAAASPAPFPRHARLNPRIQDVTYGLRRNCRRLGARIKSGRDGWLISPRASGRLGRRGSRRPSSFFLAPLFPGDEIV